MRRTCLITGAASGLGRELAAQLAQTGERLVLWDRDGERLDRTASLLGPAVVHTEVVDLVNADAARESAERSADAAGLISRVVHCASIMRAGPSLTMSATDYRATIEVNYLGAVHVARALAPLLIESGRRRLRAELVFVVSLAGLRGVSSLAGYAASQHAVFGFAQSLREELRGEPLEVRVVFTPPIATPVLSNLPELPALFRISPPQPVEKVGSSILRALEGQRGWLVLLDLPEKLLWWVQRTLPAGLELALRATRRK